MNNLFKHKERDKGHSTATKNLLPLITLINADGSRGSQDHVWNLQELVGLVETNIQGAVA